MPDAKDRIGGQSSFVLGADGYTQSTDLAEQEYVSGMNIVCRGGIAQTRPGSRTLYCLPNGNFQGCTLFTPNNGVAHLVAAVDGKIYVSPAPFTSYRRLWNLQFSATSKYVAFCSTLRSAYYNEAQELQTFDNPYSVLIMQDGVTRAAYWDGSVAAHLNPAKPPYPDQASNIQGYNQTPIGLWMIWSGNRLWVSRENIIIPGDIGDPLTFTEATYLNEVRKWTLSGPCTGMIEVPPDTSGGRGFVAFTEKDGTLFNSYIQDRTQWFSTDNFQNTILPTSGCVAPRSLITQYGLTWWFGSRGIVNANTALRQNLTSRIDYQDNQMFPSKAYLGPDLSLVCASYYENYLMMSVPSGDVKNRHTWVLDQAPFEGNVNAWVGYWTGWRPVEWCRGIVNGSERIFFASIDYDGRNRMWEAMTEERADNGCPITCYLQTREHTDNDLSMKRYNWSKFFLSQILGDVDLSVYVASTKGGFQKQKDYHIVADKGQVYADVEYSSVDGPFLVSNRPQTRLIRTPSANGDDECNACGVESTAGNMVDYAFSHLLVWSGQMGVRAYQMWMLESPERNAGDCEEDEASPRTLNDSGCSGLEVFVDTQVFETFEGTAEGVAVTVDGQEIYVTKTATSVISQANADSMAECAVQQSINVLEGDAVNTSCVTAWASTSSGDDGIVVMPPLVPPNPIPPVTSFWFDIPPPAGTSPYADYAAAAAAIAAGGSNCVGWAEPGPNPWDTFTANVSGTSMVFSTTSSSHNHPATPWCAVSLSGTGAISCAYSSTGDPFMGGSFSMEIYDDTGSLVDTQFSLSFSDTLVSSSLSAGIYTIRLYSGWLPDTNSLVNATISGSTISGYGALRAAYGGTPDYLVCT